MIGKYISRLKLLPIQLIVSRIIILWISIVLTSICSLLPYASEDQKSFYKFGPNDKLVILGLKINVYWKYSLVVLYCFVNSLIRTLYHSILQAWLINYIQDETKLKSGSIKNLAYEVTCMSTIYNWFDWFIYMNILLSQIDMVFVEISADLIMALITTNYYLNKAYQTLV